MIARPAATVILAGALMAGLSGCTLFAVQATQIEYAPSDGSQATIGQIKALNVIAISENGEDISLLGTIVNRSTEDATVNIQITDSSRKESTETGDVDARSSVFLGTEDGEQLTLHGLDFALGGLIDVYIQSGTDEGALMRVPVLPPEFEYTGLEPGPKPTPSLVPDPMATLPVEGEN